MRVLYISGPMSGMPDHNLPAFAAEAKRLRDLGYTVVNPGEVNLHVRGKLEYMEYIYRDLAAMCAAQCDTIAYLPNWTKSRGANIESGVASLLGMTHCWAHAIKLRKEFVDADVKRSLAFMPALAEIGVTGGMPNLGSGILKTTADDLRVEPFRDKLRLAFLTEPGKPRRVEENKGMYRVYEDAAPSHYEHSVWRAMTYLYYATAEIAIDEAIKSKAETAKVFREAVAVAAELPIKVIPSIDDGVADHTDSADDICEICKLPVVAGQARHGGTGNHYDCQYPDGRKSDKELFADMDSAVARAQAALDRLNMRATPFPRRATFHTSTPQVIKAKRYVKPDEDDDL